MKPEDIQIGRNYIHSDLPGSIWIGAGKRENGKFDEKFLVVIKDGRRTGEEGLIVFNQEEEGVVKGFWDGFRII